jgi:hypothetical protein
VSESDMLKGKLDELQQNMCSVTDKNDSVESNLNKIKELLIRIENKADIIEDRQNYKKCESNYFEAVI